VDRPSRCDRVPANLRSQLSVRPRPPNLPSFRSQTIRPLSPRPKRCRQNNCSAVRRLQMRRTAPNARDPRIEAVLGSSRAAIEGDDHSFPVSTRRRRPPIASPSIVRPIAEREMMSNSALAHSGHRALERACRRMFSAMVACDRGGGEPRTPIKRRTAFGCGQIVANLQ